MEKFCGCGEELNADAVKWAKDHAIEEYDSCIGCLQMMFEHKPAILDSLHKAVAMGTGSTSNNGHGGARTAKRELSTGQLRSALEKSQTQAGVSTLLGMSSATFYNRINADPQLKEIWDARYTFEKVYGKDSGMKDVVNPEPERTEEPRKIIGRNDTSLDLKTGETVLIVEEPQKNDENYNEIITSEDPVPDLVRMESEEDDDEVTRLRKICLGEVGGDSFMLVGFGGNFFGLDDGDRRFLNAMAEACDRFERSKTE